MCQASLNRKMGTKVVAVKNGGLSRSVSQQSRKATNHAPRLLVVDDDPVVGSLWERVLVQEGYLVRRLDSARSVLMELHTREFQIVILDLALADADGLELVSKIRREFDGIKIIVISGAVAKYTVPLIYSAGADAAQAKPVDLNRMRALVNGFFEPSRCWRGSLPNPPQFCAPEASAQERPDRPNCHRAKASVR